MFDTEKLISAVKARPCLWNTGDASYNKRPMKKTAWKQIGEEFNNDWSTFSIKKKNKTIDDLHKKWKHLRDYYVREKKKDISTRGSAVPARKGISKYFQMLSFLDVTIENLNNDGRPNLPKNKCSSSCDSLPKTISPPLVTTPSPPPPNAHTNFEIKKNTLTPILTCTFDETFGAEKKDHDTNFMLSLIPDMKTMTVREKFDFKFEIMTALKKIMYSKP